MHRIFFPLYRFFQQHKTALYLLLACSFILFAAFGAQLRYEEDIVKLLPRSGTPHEITFQTGRIRGSAAGVSALILR